MKSLAFLAAAAAFALVPGAAHGEGVYAGAGYTHTRDDDAGADMAGAQARLGARITPNIAVEGEGGFGTGNDDRGTLDSAWGIYGVGVAPVNRSLDVFARVGYSRVNELGRGPLQGANLRDDGVGYGVGAQVNVNESWGVRGDFTRHDGERDIDTLGTSLVRRF